MKRFLDIPPVWLALALLSVWVLDRLFPAWSLSVPAGTILGWVFIGVAFVLIAWSGYWFRKKTTPIEPRHTATALVVEGPFKISRNPIYLAMILIVIGMIIGRGTILALPVVPGLIWILRTRFILPEEAGLSAEFGADAARFFERTRRWI